MAQMAPRLIEAFRSGRGIPQSDYPPETVRMIERTTAPWFRHRLRGKWLAALPGAIARIEEGGAAMDVGCGSGVAAIVMAEAFPQARVSGWDPHPPCIERARAHAAAAGVADRVSFEAQDAIQLPAGAFDLITAFEVIHDAGDPVGLMTAIHRALAPDGAFLMQEIRCSPSPHENVTPIGRYFYACSTLYCLPTSLAHGGPGLGALMGEPKARELAIQAGFTHFRRLPIDDPVAVLYELRA
jgi:2-polyprenyl-3-methyl-5-hydroxy-6-metoxy-1,4-benzoquinol methylase